MTTPTLEQQIADLKRELALRKNVYPKFVANDKEMQIDGPNCKLSEPIALIPCDDVTEEQAVEVQANAEFIAHAPTDIDTLTAALADANRRITELEKALLNIAHDAETWRETPVNALGRDCLLSIENYARAAVDARALQGGRDDQG